MRLQAIRFRAARPSDRLAALRCFYVDALGCTLVGEFANHAGFDGLIVGDPARTWQIEFVHDHAHAAVPVPSTEHLLVFFLADAAALAQRAAAMDAAGWRRANPHNPYWARHGVAYADPDGYHVVLALPHGD